MGLAAHDEADVTGFELKIVEPWDEWEHGLFDSIGTMWSLVPTTFITGHAIDERSSGPRAVTSVFCARRSSRMSHSAI